MKKYILFLFVLPFIIYCNESKKNKINNFKIDNNFKKNDSVYNKSFTANNFDERKYLKNIIDQTEIKKGLTDIYSKNFIYKKLDTIPFIPFDSIFYNNKLKYIDVQSDSLITDDFSISNFGEYGNISSDLQLKYKKKWYIVGLSDLDENYKGLLLKYYDLITARYILYVLNKDYKITSSICLYAFFTFSENGFKDEIVGKPYLISKNTNNIYTINVEGSNNKVTYKFKYSSGIFNLIYNRIYNEDDTNFIYEKKEYKINDKDGYVNLRNEKSINGNILRTLRNGEKVTLYYSNQSKWQKVITNQNEVGFIFLK